MLLLTISIFYPLAPAAVGHSLRRLAGAEVERSVDSAGVVFRAHVSIQRRAAPRGDHRDEVFAVVVVVLKLVLLVGVAVVPVVVIVIVAVVVVVAVALVVIVVIAVVLVVAVSACK